MCVIYPWDNVPGCKSSERHSGAISREILSGGNYIWGNFPGAIIQGAIIRGAYVRGAIFLGGSFPQGQLSGWQLSGYREMCMNSTVATQEQ